MSQQVEDLTNRQISATFINGDLGPQEKPGWYRLLRTNAFKFYFITPEQFDASMERPDAVQSRPGTLIPSDGRGTFGASWRVALELGETLTAWGTYPDG